MFACFCGGLGWLPGKASDEVADFEFKLPSFEEAEAKFQDFILEIEGKSDLIWVFREDLNLSDKNEILVLQPNRVRNREVVKKAYENSLAKKFGILLDVVCSIQDGGFCAYFFIPEDNYEAESRMIHGLKLGSSGLGIRRTGRIAYRPSILSSLARRFGPEKSDPWLLDIPLRKRWE